MKTWHSYQLDDLDYYKFSIYHFGNNMQSVYMYKINDILIDTAQSRSRRNVMAALSGSKIDTVLITHHHEDHTGNAGWIQQNYKSSLRASELCSKWLAKGPYVSPLGRLISGSVQKAKAIPIEDYEVLDLGKTTLQAIHTPGHTDDHMAFYEPNRGWLFSGDLYVADRIKYFEANEEIDVQIDSLEKLAVLDFDVLLCSHNPKVKDGKSRLLRKLELFKDFYGQVSDRYAKGMSASDIFESTGRKENNFYKFITVGQFTAINLVKSVIRAEKRKAK